MFLCHWDYGRFGAGRFGVRLFFALSGFLITRILILSSGATIGESLRVFYLRRVLRIFPLYYAYLAVLAAVGRLDAPAWQLTYLTNLYAFLTGGPPGYTAHFWSLAVEEQFYLLFPVLFLSLPARCRLAGLVGAYAVCQLCRVGLVVGLGGPPWYGTLIVTAGVPILLGAMAGVWELARPRGSRGSPPSWLLWVGCALLVLVWLDPLRSVHSIDPRQVYLDVGDVAYAAIVLGVWRSTGVVARVLSWPPVVYLGRISYGLYVLHVPVLLWAQARYGLGPRAFLVGVVGTVAAASVSWYCFERPILGLKRYFPYRENNTRVILRWY